MKKLRNKIILILLLINLSSSVLSELISEPFLTEVVGDQRPEVVEVVEGGIRSAITLIIFAAFVILGVREITAPILKLTGVAQKIAEGDYSVEIPRSRRRDELGQLERSFDTMVKELRSTEYMQKDFINNISHEYKTPLSIITGNAKLLRDGNLTEQERTQYSQYIVEEAQRLSRMTANILLLSKLENQSIHPAFAPYGLDEQLRQAVLLYMDRAAEKGLTFEIDIESAVVTGNEELLLMVWTNLIDNAVKFSRSGGTITIRCRKSGDGQIVSVADQGAGIAEDAIPYIFNQFYQADSSRTGAGNGLGLALTRRILELHQGSIEVQSAPGEGTVFTVII